MAIFLPLLGVLFLFSIANKFRTYRFNLKEQLVIIYSGIRGASSFSLAFLLPAVFFPKKKMFITSTIVVIYFTVFIQASRFTLCGVHYVMGLFGDSLWFKHLLFHNAIHHLMWTQKHSFLPNKGNYHQATCKVPWC